MFSESYKVILFERLSFCSCVWKNKTISKIRSEERIIWIIWIALTLTIYFFHFSKVFKCLCLFGLLYLATLMSFIWLTLNQVYDKIWAHVLSVVIPLSLPLEATRLKILIYLLNDVWPRTFVLFLSRWWRQIRTARRLRSILESCCWPDANRNSSR